MGESGGGAALGVPAIAKPATATAWLAHRMVADVTGAGIVPEGALSTARAARGPARLAPAFDVVLFHGIGRDRRADPEP